MNRKQRRAAATSSTASLSPAFVEAFNAGLKLHEMGRLDDAEPFYMKAMALNPSHALLISNLGVLYYARGDVERAIETQKRAIKLDPNLGIAHNNLGVALNRLERHEEAIPAFRRAIEIEPNNSRALNNLGDSLTKSGRFEESIGYLKRTLELDPQYAEAKSNMGMAYWGLGDIDGAISWLRASIALDPSLATVHKNLGLVLLLKRDFAEGWIEYNYRLAADGIPLRGGPDMPIWRGQNPGEGALFIFSEQGVGDEILYAGLLPELTALEVRIMWETDGRLIPLIQRSFPNVRCVPRTMPPVVGSPAADVVAQLPAGSLGQLFRPSMAHFPMNRKGYLSADKARGQAYRAGFNLAPGEKLVGISWVSKNMAFGKYKSTTLTDWAEILRTPGVRFVDLQYGDTSVERAALRAQLGLTVEHVDGLDLRDDLDGMAALTSACDMIITVSNTTAHVAGALGLPTWVFVPVDGGKLWYWGAGTDSTPWYPSISIIRQLERGVWGSTLHIAAERLRALPA